MSRSFPAPGSSADGGGHPAAAGGWGDDRRGEADRGHGPGKPHRVSSGAGTGAFSLAQNHPVNSLWPQLRFSGATWLQRVPPAPTPPSCVLRLGRPRHPNSQFLLTGKGFRGALSRHRSRVPGRMTTAGSCFPFQFRGQRRLRAESLTLHLPSAGPGPAPRPASCRSPAPKSPALAKLHPRQAI